MTQNDNVLDEEQKRRAAKIRAEIAEKERPLYKKALDFFKGKDIQKVFVAIALIALGVAGAKLWDSDAFNQRFDVTKAKIVDPVEERVAEDGWVTRDGVDVKLKMPSLDAEVFIKEEGATEAERQLVTDHADARSIEARMLEMEEKITALTSAINNGAAAGLATGITESRVNTLAREQVEYYKRNEDAIAKRKGWRNYITWKEIVNYRN